MYKVITCILRRLQKGRPADFEKRLEKEQKVYEMLDNLGIEYDYVDHDEAMTIEACKDIEKVLGVGICKNLFLCNRQKTDFYLLLIDETNVSNRCVKIIGTSVFLSAMPTICSNFLILPPADLSSVRS